MSQLVKFSIILLSLLAAACQDEAPCTGTSCPLGRACVAGSCVARDSGVDGGGAGGGAAGGGVAETGGGAGGGVGDCGNGRLSASEGCDDGNATGGDGCSATCTVEPGHLCPAPGHACVAVKCGDGRLSGAEQCDDGNETPGDGCTAGCILEEGWACPVVGVACGARRCGDGLVVGFEECDDGNAVAGDGCSATCTLEEGHACPTPGMACVATTCGDGTREGTEQCDDANFDLGDGCDTTCHLEPRCDAGTCTPACGDGVRLPQEACDDGNVRSGDGCSSTCVIEDGFTCGDAAPAAQPSLAIAIVYRDFIPNSQGGHVDFENATGDDLGIVGCALDDHDKPVYAHTSTPTTHSKTAFDQWYRDTAGVNRTVPDRLVVSRTDAGTYVFANNEFFPLDGRGWTSDGKETAMSGNGGMHNFAFTSELRYWFTFSGGEALTFFGDDDVFVFINRTLAMDLGGVHDKRQQTVTLEGAKATSLGLSDGGIYEVAVFQAERHTVGSNYMLTLKGFNAIKSTCRWTCGDGVVTRYESCDDGKNDGSYGGCMPGCLAHGPYCGDGHVDSTSQETCDDGLNTGVGGACAPGCKSLSGCGDGVVQESLGETCDDGNRTPGDGCDETCHAEIG